MGRVEGAEGWGWEWGRRMGMGVGQRDRSGAEGCVWERGRRMGVGRGEEDREGGCSRKGEKKNINSLNVCSLSRPTVELSELHVTLIS